MKKILIVGYCLTLITASGFSDEIYRIQTRGRQKDCSISEINRRLYELEMTVIQLQNKIVQLEQEKKQSFQPQSNPWTCHIQSFGKTFASTNDSKSKALSEVLEKCSEASSAVHCRESAVSCGDD